MVSDHLLLFLLNANSTNPSVYFFLVLLNTISYYCTVILFLPLLFLVQDGNEPTMRNTTYCSSTYLPVWLTLSVLYLAVVGTSVLFLSYKNTSITSLFKEEGEMGTLITAIVLLLGLVSLIIFILVVLTGLTRQIVFWINTFISSFLPAGVLLSLHVPKVSNNRCFLSPPPPLLQMLKLDTLGLCLSCTWVNNY